MRHHSPDIDLWIEAARQVQVATYATLKGWKFKPNDGGGPCPGCGGIDRFSISKKKNVWNCGHSAADGGDAIGLAQHVLGLNFFEAVEEVGGQPRPGPVRETEAERDARRAEIQVRLDAARAQSASSDAAAAQRERDYRAGERARLYELWKSALPAKGSPVESYFALRGLHLPSSSWLKFMPDLGLWDKPKPSGGKIVHRGPCMLAQCMRPDGKFSGLHQTWLDLNQPKGKAVIFADGVQIDAKKTRGSTKGCFIQIAKHWQSDGATGGPQRLFMGEGIETVTAVWSDLIDARSPLLVASEFRSSLNLGNLGRGAAGRVAHPTDRITVIRKDKTTSTRPRMVNNDEPLAEDPYPLIPLPALVQELYLLQDGDSDAFNTRNTLLRCAKSYQALRPDLKIKICHPGAGIDFNDLRAPWLQQNQAVNSAGDLS